MAMDGKKLGLVHCLVAISVIAFAFALVEGGGDGPTICNIALNKLSQCRSAVTGKYPRPPTKGCCSLIKQANLTCLCGFKDQLPALKIDPAKAFALPKKCGLPTPPQCRA